MTTTSPTRRRLARASAAVAAVASLGGLSAATASAESAPAAEATSISCWKEYDFYLSGATVVATAYKDCTNYDVPQLLPVTIQAFNYDEVGPSGWVNWKSGTGVAKTTCIPGWPMWYRHSATLEIIYC